MSLFPRPSGPRAPRAVFAFAVVLAAAACKIEISRTEVTADVVDGGGGGDRDGAASAGRRRQAICTSRPPSQLKTLGEACTCSNECVSSQCVDGVCCTDACTQTCHACDVPGKLGRCTPVPKGQAPVVDGQCAREAPSTCGSSGLCDGSGHCQKYADGTTCVPGRCESGNLVGSGQCSGGKCQPIDRIICAPYACDPKAAACFGICDDSRQCVAGRSCEQRSCGKKPLGAVCAGPGECESTFCADGVCCNEACKGACRACNQVGKAGECAPVIAGNSDPHELCKDDGVASCGFAGVCNGKGGCAKYASGTLCKAASCTGNTLEPTSVCDGAGVCVRGATIDCSPFACTGGSCNSSCSTTSMCAAPATCVDGSCGQKPDGIACVAGSECKSGNCVDGVCCNEACDGLCRFCNSPGNPGRCVNVAGGVADPRAASGVKDPARACLDQGPSACGRNGSCNGAGGCALYPPGTVCKPDGCNAATNIYVGASACDGAGQCVTPASRSCSPFTCNGSRCFTSCSSNTQCLGANTCQAGSCGLLPVGALCSAGTACASGVCAQGACCATACGGSCVSCNLPGSAGTCKAVPAGGTDPAGQCSDQGAATCGNDGACNGAGACRKYLAGTVCAAESCAAGMAKAKSTCVGNGVCQAGAMSACAPGSCNPAGTACAWPPVCTLPPACTGGPVPIGQWLANDSAANTGSSSALASTALGTVVYGPGHDGKAFQFRSKVTSSPWDPNYVAATPSAPPFLTVFTLDTWVQTTGFNSYGESNRVVVGTTFQNLFTANQALIYLHENANFYAYVKNDANGVVCGFNATAASILNKWTRLTASYDGTTLRCYTNGALVSSAVLAASGSVRITDLTIGRNFPGDVDDVRVFDQALTAAEIAGL